MGFARLEEIAVGLVANGLDPEHPRGGGRLRDDARPGGRRLDMERVADDAAGLRSPALVVVGDVVSLSERIAADRGTLAVA